MVENIDDTDESDGDNGDVSFEEIILKNTIVPTVKPAINDKKKCETRWKNQIAFTVDSKNSQTAILVRLS